jgi:hypothetical protein
MPAQLSEDSILHNLSLVNTLSMNQKLVDPERYLHRKGKKSLMRLEKISREAAEKAWLKA